MTIKSNAVWVFLLLCAIALCAGCGDTFRPVVNPVASPPPDPQTSAHANILAQTADGVSPGTVTQIDVSGDTVTAQQPLGVNPVYAAAANNGFAVFTANKGSDNIGVYSAISAASFAPSTITLPAGAAPVFLQANSSNLYVAESGTNTVGVISLSTDIRSKGVAVGARPVALAVTPAGDKVYSINQGDGTVSVIGTVDNVVVKTIAVGKQPAWVAINFLGALIYVVNSGDNTLSVIDTSTDTVVATLAVGTAPNYVIFDPKLKRVYVTNPGSNTLSIINADLNSPAINTVISVAVGAAPVSVTALADGTRVYVANSGSNNVSVVATISNTVVHTLAVGTTPVSIASSNDSSKVFVANRGSGNISIIRTAEDAVLPPRPAGSAKPVYVFITL